MWITFAIKVKNSLLFIWKIVKQGLLLHHDSNNAIDNNKNFAK